MAEEAIKLLKRKRGNVKAKLSSFNAFISRLEDKTLLDNTTIIQLQDRISSNSELLADFDHYNNELIAVVDDDLVQTQFDERHEFEEAFFAVMSRAKALLKATQPLSNNTNSNDASVAGTGAEGSTTHKTEHVMQQVKLPPLNLLKFNGQYSDWLPFYDTFSSLIHNDNSLTPIQKFHYLRSCLQDEALQVIQSLEISNDNYSQAWELLEKRYKNKQLMIHNHIKGIFDLPKLTKESFSNTRNLLDTAQNHLRALKVLGEPVDKWDSLLIYIITDKFDYNTKKDWESIIVKTDQSPTMTMMTEFLEQRCQLLEKINKQISSYQSPQHTKQRQDFKTSNNKVSQSLSYLSTQKSCIFCKGSHPVFACKTFLDLSVNDRISAVKKHKICLNCLKPGHISVNCKFSNCPKCSKKHNGLLHVDPIVENMPDDSSNTTEQSKNITLTSQVISIEGGIRVLPTAIISIFDSEGKSHDCTALLDSGSHTNFMSIKLLNLLKLNPVKGNTFIRGINNVNSISPEMVTATIMSKQSDFKATLSYLILPQITDNLPSIKLDSNSYHIPNTIKLADPLFYKPKQIDLLLGVDIFSDILRTSSDNLDHPFLINTQLGHIFLGNVSRSGHYGKKVSCNLCVTDTESEITKQLSKFWEVEDLPISNLNQQGTEHACESHFKENTKQNENGQFIVSLPLKGSLDLLGESKKQAIKRFSSLEKRLQANPSMYQMYIDFMREYENLGHMSKVDYGEKTPTHTYYMPHHGVLKPSSTTTKLRVVFNASAPTSTGVSINDLQMVGPTIQDDLVSILLRFRKHNVVISGDCTKMYRSVLVENSQRPLQRIVWRESPDQPLETYNLNTVTYGTASASFLAIRCLFELSYLAENDHPDISKIIQHDMYVDDLLTGSETINEAKRIITLISTILKSGGFHLRKWHSNKPEVLEDVDPADTSSHFLDFSADNITQTLGLYWNNHTDELLYNVSIQQNHLTKRSALSTISKIFDPLGLLSPIIIIAKIFMQQLWSEKLSWDDPLPIHLNKKWQKYIDDLIQIINIRIPRQVICHSANYVEIHAFCDASEVAYGGCVYLKSINTNDCLQVRLLCSKSKVAPLKQLTIPRLELCGAIILVRLVQKVIISLQMPIQRCIYWCDSSIVLGWIKSDPSHLKQFVSNRVYEIHSKSNPNDWRHVPTHDNPADLLSRGVTPKQLQTNALWWMGPSWLQKEQDNWPNILIQVTHDLPEKKISTYSHVSTNSVSSFSFEKYSDLSRLEKYIAWILRFKTNCLTPKFERKLSRITIDEVKQAHLCLIRISQNQSFLSEITILAQGKSLPSNSKILNLNPFLSDNILRVGGRLENSNFPYDKKHPIILHSKHPFTKLLVAREHIRLLHAGPQLLLSTLRDSYWPTRGKELVRKIVHSCVTCFKVKPKRCDQLLGNLPKHRVDPAPPFFVTGVDYAGPINIKDRQGRGCKTSKAYIAVFICFTTHALHIELVTDLSTDKFIFTLRRFVSRRGMPSHIYSDNGSNFVGANRELHELGKFLLENNSNIVSRLMSENCTWHFIPAYSPHMGGYWESGVKSIKYHLRRVMKKSVYTYEELNTLLCQIECVLNSRPLSPMSNDPNDLFPLTPSHFLIGRVLTTVPDPDVTFLNSSKLDHYQQIQQSLQMFWMRWSKEYIAELQQRQRWRITQRNVKIGDMVVISEDNRPPLHWLMGRITQVHPGADGIVRVASIRTSSGIIKRCVSKLCVLPLDSTHQESSNKCE